MFTGFEDFIKFIKEFVSFAIEFVFQFMPVILMVIIQYLANINYTNADYYSNMLQVFIVDSSISLLMTKDIAKRLSRDIYILILIMSVTLFILIQTSVIVGIKDDRGVWIFYVLTIMLVTSFLLRIENYFLKGERW